jgi:hypothetical protein
MRSGAEAIIIVNDKEDDLFVMADGGLDEEEVGETPLTVLVTKHDGDEMIAAMQVATMVARVHLIPHTGEIDSNGVFTGPIDWPMVRTSSEPVVQVLSESGWGVHAINRRDNQQNGQEWQIFFVAHNGNQD